MLNKILFIKIMRTLATVRETRAVYK